MRLDQASCYRALSARDARFDGLFFVGVTTTGIYCRPVCPARTPRSDRCRFFANAAAAENARFRPCLRCRPELAPGHAPVDAVGRIARRAAARIEAGALNEGGSLETLASELGLSTRQLRRAVRQEFGVSPVALAQTRRLLLAKQLLTETRLPLINVALASGFGSVRRFNTLFRSHYEMPPSRLRRAAGMGSSRESLALTLSYRPPMAWDILIDFLAGRCTAGIEAVDGRAYLRTIALGNCRGWIRVEPAVVGNYLTVEIATTLTPVLPALLPRIRALFDLDARPEVIAEQLGADPRLGRILQTQPCLRVPGCVDGFELAVRTILGQVISVAAATTLAGRLAAAFGEPIDTPYPALWRLSPRPDRLAQTEDSALLGLGIALPRARAIRAVASALIAGRITLEPSADPEAIIRRLRELPGIGVWTAHYIAMRALRWPDAFPAADLGLLRASGLGTARQLERAAESWRPWRAYAAMVLWNGPPPAAADSSPERSRHEPDDVLPASSQPDRLPLADLGRPVPYRATHEGPGPDRHSRPGEPLDRG